MTAGDAKSTVPHPSRPKSATCSRASAQHVSCRMSEAGTAALHGLAVPVRGRSPGANGRPSRSPVRSGRNARNAEHALSVPRRAKSAGGGRDIRPMIGVEGLRRSNTSDNNIRAAGSSISGTIRRAEEGCGKDKNNSGKQAAAAPKDSHQRRNVQVTSSQNTHSSPSHMRSSNKSSSNSSQHVNDVQSRSKSNVSSDSTHTLHNKVKVTTTTTSGGKVRPVQVVRPLQRIQNTPEHSGSSRRPESPAESSGLSSSQRAPASAGSIPGQSHSDTAADYRMGNPVSRELLVASGLDNPRSSSLHGNLRTTASLPPSSSLSSQAGSLNAYRKDKTLPSSHRVSVGRGGNSASHPVDTVRGNSTGSVETPVGKESRVFSVNSSFSARDRDCSVSPGYVGDIVRDFQNSEERTSHPACIGTPKASQHMTSSVECQNTAIRSRDAPHTSGASQTAGSFRKTERIPGDSSKGSNAVNRVNENSSDTERVVLLKKSSQQQQRDTVQQSRISDIEESPTSSSSACQNQVNSESHVDMSHHLEPVIPVTEQNVDSSQGQRQSAFVPVVSRNTRQAQVSTSGIHTTSTNSHSSGESKSHKNNGATNERALHKTRNGTRVETDNQNSSFRTQPLDASTDHVSENQVQQSNQQAPPSDHQRLGQASSPARTPNPSVGNSSSGPVDVIQNTGVQLQGPSGHPSALQRYDNNEALPDILNSHLLPPYTAIRPNQHRQGRPSNNATNHGQRERQRHPQGNNRPRSRHHSNSPPGMTDIPGELKECCSRDCCLQCITVATTFRWVLVSLALLGVCCVITGIILGALHMTVGEKFLTLSLMFIGLGVLLVVVVGVGWRCTPAGHEPCHVLFNLGEHRRPSTRTRTTRQPRRDRGGWYGGMLYPEFRNRRPPPSYAASMQDHPVQDDTPPRQNENHPNMDNYSLPSSPPPTYRSQSSTMRPGIHITFPPTQGGPYPSSHPPTYRSSAGEPRPSIDMVRGQEPGQTRDVEVQREGSQEPEQVDTVHRHVQAETGGNGGENIVNRASTTVAIDPECHSTIILVTAEEETQDMENLIEDDRQMVRGNETTNTLHREQEVVQYLEGVLDDQIRKLSATESGTEDDMGDISVLMDELWYESERADAVKAEMSEKIGQEAFSHKVSEVKEGETLQEFLEVHSESCNNEFDMDFTRDRFRRNSDRCVGCGDNSEGSNGVEEGGRSSGVTVNSYIATVQVKNYLPPQNDVTETELSNHGDAKESHDRCVDSDAPQEETVLPQFDREIRTRDKDIQSCVVMKTTETQTSESSEEEMEAQVSDTPL